MSDAYQVREDLKSEIRGRGLTIAAAARAAGISYACMSAMLNGRARPSLRVMRAVALVLCEPVDSLFPNTPRTGGLTR